MKKTLCILILLCIGIVNIWSQQNFRIVFYNVENLFDTKDNPKKNDDDFLPQGKQHWTNYRYWKKLNDISKVISSINEGYPPSLVGLCEIENATVLDDLTQKAALNRHKYKYIVTNSSDDRGMNVGLLYQRDEMKILAKKEYRPHFENEPHKKTRNILHVTGKIITGDTLDIFVCHFHSRVEGIKKTNPYREQTAALIKEKVDNLFKVRKKANIIIMGDFNDYPNSSSLLNVLKAKDPASNISNKSLYNLFYNKSENGKNGSYKYRGKWNFLDQFIVSGNLLVLRNNIHIKNKKAYVYSPDYLLEDDPKYGDKKIFRTYLGFKYLGGTSDHLPIYMDLFIQK